jgi:hypothetical protein
MRSLSSGDGRLDRDFSAAVMILWKLHQYREFPSRQAVDWIAQPVRKEKRPPVPGRP